MSAGSSSPTDFDDASVHAQRVAVPPSRIVFGAMTGTSLDGIDVAVAEIRGRGLELRARLLRHLHGELGALTSSLRRVATQEPVTAREFAELAWAFGERHAELLGQASEEHAPDLVVLHGQTVYHAPPISLQLINAAPVADRLACPVVFDLRQADLAAGGQGAPITPLADWILLRHPTRRRVIVNLGGFCNLTVLPAGTTPAAMSGIRGGDVCVCNHVLDEVARRGLGHPYDVDGATAERGRVDADARAELLEVLSRQAADRPGRSLGTGDEAGTWVSRQVGRLEPDALAATAVAAVGERISTAIAGESPDEVVLAGGSVRNRALCGHLARSLRSPVVISDELGIPAESREALSMAVLGALCVDDVPITLPQVTGCRTPTPLAGVRCRQR